MESLTPDCARKHNHARDGCFLTLLASDRPGCRDIIYRVVQTSPRTRMSAISNRSSARQLLSTGAPAYRKGLEPQDRVDTDCWMMFIASLEPPLPMDSLPRIMLEGLPGQDTQALLPRNVARWMASQGADGDTT